MYNYGSPRVGNWAYSSKVDGLFAAIYRVVHNADIVPHVPPCSLFGPCSISANGDGAEEISTTSVGNIIWKPWHSGTEEWWNEDFTSY